MILTFPTINFDLFNMLLANFNSSVEFAIFTGIPSGDGPYHMKSSPPICNKNPLTSFYMVGDFSGGYLEQIAILILILMLMLLFAVI